VGATLHESGFGRGLSAADFLQQCCGDECLILLERAEQDPQRRVSVSNHVFEINCLRVAKKANQSTQAALLY